MTHLASILLLLCALCARCVTPQAESEPQRLAPVAGRAAVQSSSSVNPPSSRTGIITWTPGNVESSVIIEHCYALPGPWELFAQTNQPPVPIVMDQPHEFFRARWLDNLGQSHWITSSP